MNFSNEEIQKIYYEDYIESRLTIKQIADKYNTYSEKISKLFKENEYPIQRVQRLSFWRKYNVDENYFEKIDTEEKAYWLGFLYADGCIGKHSVILQLAIKDYNHVEMFKKALKSEHKIEIMGRTLDNGNYYEYARISIHSIKLANDLIADGCLRRKTFTCTFPSYDIVPKNLIRHFIRGVFDGDGCITFLKDNKITFEIAGNINIVTGIQNELYVDNVVERLPKLYPIKSIYTVDIFGKYNAMNIMNYLYDDASIYLQRKYDIFLRIKESEIDGSYARYCSEIHKCDICGDVNSVRYVTWHKEGKYKETMLCSKHYIQLCNFNEIIDEEPYSKPQIYCLNSKMIFDTQKEAAEWAGLKSSHGIRLCIEGKQKTSGHHPETGELLQWAEYDESKYEEYENYKYNCTEIFERVRERPIYQLDINTEEILRKFMSSSEAGRWLGLKNFSNITSCCKGRRNYAFGYKWKYVDEYGLNTYINQESCVD